MLHPPKTNMEPEKPTKHNGFKKKTFSLCPFAGFELLVFRGVVDTVHMSSMDSDLCLKP